MLKFLSLEEALSLPREDRIDYYQKERELKGQAYDLLENLVLTLMSEESDLILKTLKKRKEKLKKIRELYKDQKFLVMRSNLRKLFREAADLLERKNKAILKRLRDRQKDPEEEAYFRRKEVQIKALSLEAEKEMCQFCSSVMVDPSRFLFTYRLWR